VSAVVVRAVHAVVADLEVDLAAVPAEHREAVRAAIVPATIQLGRV